MARYYLVRPGGVLDLVLISLLGFMTTLLSILTPGSFPLELLSFFCIFFAPGWSILAFAFPGHRAMLKEGVQSPMDLLERVAASIMLSMVCFALGGLLLAWSPLGLTKLTVLLFALALTIGLSALAIWKRSNLPKGEGFALSFELPPWEGRLNNLEKGVLVLGVIGVIIAAGIAADALMKPTMREEPFTELYLTGLDGKVSSLPQTMSQFLSGTVQVHVKNEMHSSLAYNLTIGIPQEGNFSDTTSSDWNVAHVLNAGDGYRFHFVLADHQEISKSFTFRIPDPGRQQVLFSLDFAGDKHQTWLWVTIT